MASLGSTDWLAEVVEEEFVDAIAPPDVLGDEDPAVIVETDGAAVEGLVVEGAESHAVVLGVSAAGSVPANMGGLDAEISVAEHAVVAANGAAVLVDPEDGVAEGRIAAGLLGGGDPRHANCVEDVMVETRREVVLEYAIDD